MNNIFNVGEICHNEIYNTLIWNNTAPAGMIACNQLPDGAGYSALGCCWKMLHSFSVSCCAGGGAALMANATLRNVTFDSNLADLMGGGT